MPHATSEASEYTTLEGFCLDGQNEMPFNLDTCIILPELQLANSFYVQISMIIPGSARVNNNVRISEDQSGDIAKYNFPTK